MNALAILPPKLHADFFRAPKPVKERFNLWLDTMDAMEKAADKMAEAVKWASKLGVSPKTVFTRKSQAKKEGLHIFFDLRWDASLWDSDREDIPGKTVEYLKKLAGDNQRGSAGAIRALKRQLRKWKAGDLTAAIPGYDAPPAGDPPIGWSDRNLARFLPSKFEKAAERRGLSYAVGSCGPQVFRDRAKLWYGSHYVIDDLWHDNFVVYNGVLCRVLELDLLEVFSGSLCFWGTKPRLRRKDGTYDTGLEQYVPLVLAGQLFTEGFSPRGTTILAEHGTAAVPERIQKLFRDYFPELIKVRESGITGEEQAIVGRHGKGKGNPRFKSWLESRHSLTHNELASLPTQTGKDRDHRPEFTHGQLEDADDMLKVISALQKRNPARASQLELATLDYQSAFLPLQSELYRELDFRDWHNLQGWHDIPGNVVMEYRLAPNAEQWLSDAEFKALPDISRQMLLTAAQQDRRFLRPRKLSPGEVRRRDRGSLTPLPAWAVSEMIGTDFGRELEVGGAYFNTFEDGEIAAEPLRFESVIVDIEGNRQQLKDGTYFVVMNPFDPTCLFVHDGKLGKKGFLGTAPRATRIDMTDNDQLRRAYGHQKKRLAELTKPILARHASDVRRETARLKKNADVIQGMNDEQADYVAEAREALLKNAKV